MDLGPLLPAAAMTRIDSYIGGGPDFDTVDHARLRANTQFRPIVPQLAFQLRVSLTVELNRA